MTENRIEDWIDLYSSDLLRWASLKLDSEDLAKDLVQETFIAAHQKMASFKAKSNPKTWLSSILNNKIIDYFRSAEYKRKVQFQQGTEARDIESYFFKSEGAWQEKRFDSNWEEEEALLDREDFRTLFSSCIQGLPDLWRDVIAAKYFGKQSGSEICKEFNISTSNYWQINHRAKLQLKKCIEVYWEL